MKKILILVLTFSSTLAWAQIPNAGFENWNTIKSFSVAHWQTVGDAKQVTDAESGTYAMAVYNKKDNNSFGLFANASVQEGLIGGDPYTQHPLTFLCYAKYDIDSMDRGSITAIFKSQGNIAGIAELVFRGNSNNQFVLKSIPIQWYSFDQPDTVLIVCSSIDLDKGFVEEDGFMIIDSIHFKTVFTLNDLPINASFEDRTESTQIVPQNWVTVDQFLEEAFGQKIPIKAVNQTTDKYAGNFGISLENKIFGEDTFPGVILVGQSVDDLEKPSFAVAGKSTFLNGYYKYVPENGDNAVIMLSMFKNGNEIGKLEVTDLLPTAIWKPFSKAIGYFGSEIPDSASLIFSSADLDNPKGANSKLWIDALEFSNSFLSVTSNKAIFVNIYPNPATRYFYIPLEIEQINSVIIRDIQGKIYARYDDLLENKIDVSAMANGVYYIEIINNDQVINSKLIKK